MPQAEDFRQKSRALHKLVLSIPVSGYIEATQFKGRTILKVIRHLHFWNQMAHFQLSGPERLAGFLNQSATKGISMHAYEKEQLKYPS